MHFRMLAFVGLAGLLLASPAAVAADAGCCGEKAAKACCDMPCCQDQVAMAEANAVDVLLSMDQLTPAPARTPARQATVVWFHRPVMVGRQILQGQYVIEHDNDRMARGEPCTFIYAFDDRTKPVVTFHCVHLDRPPSTAGNVVLASNGDTMQVFLEFQFAGETGAHGFPTVR